MARRSGQRPSIERAAGASLWLTGLVLLLGAQAKGDIVTLVSGNRMTGNIVSLDRGQLTFAIDGAGAVDIDWRNVQSLESSRMLEFELSSGDRLTGSLAASRPGTLEIEAATLSEVVDLQEVVRIFAVAATVRDRTSASLELGFDFLSANDETDFMLSGEMRNRTRSYLTQIEAEMIVRRFDDQTVQERNLLDVRSRRYLDNRWFALGELLIEKNMQLGLDRRVLVGIAGGRTFVQSSRTSAAAYVGVDYDVEGYQNADGRQGTAELLGAVEWDWFEIGGSTELTSRATVYPSLEDDRVRYEVSASLRRYVFGSFYWSIVYYKSYNSDPPPELPRHDYGLTVTLGRSF